MATITSLCPQALIFVLFAMTHIVLDTMKGYYNEAFVKIWVSLIYTLILNILCTRGLGTIAWFLVLLPFIFMTAIVAMIIFSFGLSKNGKELSIFERSNNQQMRSIPNIIPGMSSAAKDVARQYNPEGDSSLETTDDSTKDKAGAWEKLLLLLEGSKREDDEPVASNDDVDESSDSNSPTGAGTEDNSRKDCVGQWSESSCEDGIKRRDYKVTQSAQAGGKKCNVEHNSTQTGSCAPVDCKGEWTWADKCESVNGVDKFKRTYEITQAKEWDGKDCPFIDGNVDYGPCTSVTITGGSNYETGETLTANQTNFTDPIKLQYQWKRQKGSNMINIGSATNSYTITDADEGSKIIVDVLNTELNSNEKLATATVPSGETLIKKKQSPA